MPPSNRVPVDSNGFILADRECPFSFRPSNMNHIRAMIGLPLEAMDIVASPFATHKTDLELDLASSLRFILENPIPPKNVHAGSFKLTFQDFRATRLDFHFPTPESYFRHCCDVPVDVKQIEPRKDSYNEFLEVWIIWRRDSAPGTKVIHDTGNLERCCLTSVRKALLRTNPDPGEIFPFVCQCCHNAIQLYTNKQNFLSFTPHIKRLNFITLMILEKMLVTNTYAECFVVTRFRGYIPDLKCPSIDYKFPAPFSEAPPSLNDWKYGYKQRPSIMVLGQVSGNGGEVGVSKQEIEAIMNKMQHDIVLGDVRNVPFKGTKRCPADKNIPTWTIGNGEAMPVPSEDLPFLTRAGRSIHWKTQKTLRYLQLTPPALPHRSQFTQHQGRCRNYKVPGNLNRL